MPSGNDPRPDPLYSSRVHAGKRWYRFDVREYASGHRCLTIAESRPEDDGWHRSSVLVPEEYLPEFVNGLLAALHDELSPRAEMAARLTLIGAYPRAGVFWQREELEILRVAVTAGMSIEDIALALGRKPNSIRDRIRRLGLDE